MADYYGTRTGEQIDTAVTEINDAGNSVVARLSGSGTPSSDTVARIGDLYLDTDTHFLYVCIAAGEWQMVYDLPLASSTIPGGIVADAKTASDTIPVRVDSAGKAFVSPAGGGGGVPVTTDLLAGDGQGGIIAATPGTDYIKAAPQVTNLLQGDGFGGIVDSGVSFNTTLWSGSWASGRVTVPNSENYNMFFVTLSGSGTIVPVIKHASYLRGIGGYPSAAGDTVTYEFAATIDGDVWTFDRCHSMKHNGSGNHGSTTAQTVTSIRGVM